MYKKFLFTAVFAASALASTVTMAKATQVTLNTSKGNIVLELYPEKAPKTVANFIHYANAGHYNGTIFHRVINNFMIQGGGMTKDMREKQTKAPIQNEADNGLKNDLGTVAMARTGMPHSATSQFFINVKNNDFLNHRNKTMRGWGYTVFGKVVKGMDVVNTIKTVPTTNKAGHGDVPKQSIVINSVKVN